MAKMTLKYVGPSAAVSIPASPEFMVGNGEAFEVEAELGEALLLSGCEIELDPETGEVVKSTPTPAAPFKKTRKKGSSE